MKSVVEVACPNASKHRSKDFFLGDSSPGVDVRKDRRLHEVARLEAGRESPMSPQDQFTFVSTELNVVEYLGQRGLADHRPQVSAEIQS